MMTTLVGEATVRRPAEGVEVQAGVAAAGCAPRVMAENDVLLALACPGARVRCRRRVDSVPPALLSVVEAGEVVALELPVACRFRAVYLAPGLLAELSRRLRTLTAGARRSRRRIHCVATGRALCEAADCLHSEASVSGFLERALAGGACTVRLAADERMEHAVVRRVRDYLCEAYARQVSLDELAGVAGMCKYALVRAFSKEVGMPPHAYQTYVRVLRARELIAAGRRLSSVALDVGFTDQSHLSRNFKRVLGVTPGRYARLAQEVEEEPAPVQARQAA
jgi:AraC-like DNA-binding protein